MKEQMVAIWAMRSRVLKGWHPPYGADSEPCDCFLFSYIKAVEMKEVCGGGKVFTSAFRAHRRDCA
jgi:hypothetical protein